MTGPIDNTANDVIYKGVTSGKAYASADTTKDAKIDATEAQQYSGTSSIFNEAKQKGEAQIDEAIKNSTRLSQDAQGNAKSVVQKYLGGVSFSGLLNNWSGFGQISYDLKVLDDAEYESDVQAKIDNIVDPKITDRVNRLATSITQQYQTALDNAIKQAENELVGDADIMSDGKVKGEDENFSLDNITYERSNGGKGENTNVATFESSKKGADASQGYINTTAYLEANGAKAKTKIVNGQEQTVYKVKVDGETQWVTVDDAGQVHQLDRDKGFLRKSKFTTEDSIADAAWQSRNDGVDGNNVPRNMKGVKVKVRKVDGQDQSVMTWKDDKGVKHSRVIDHNDVSGLTTSMDVHQVNAGGRAKYASDVSGLGVYAGMDETDNVKFTDSPHRFQNGTWTDDNGGVHANNVNTQRGRMKLDAQHIGKAISSISTDARNAGANVVENGDITTITFPNNHQYVLDRNDNVQTDRTIRLIQGEINRGGQNTITLEDEHVDTTGVTEDDRETTNNAAVHTRDKWAKGVDGSVQDVGVNNIKDHTPSDGGKGKINSVHYDNSTLTRAQFTNEGWRASAGRKDEAAILEKMDSADVKGEGKSVRNLKTANEFAERFIKAKGGDPSKYNLDKLAKALTAANPSFFDADGNMFKECDFSRINLPKKLDRYAN